ncbi:hypothetical protein ACSSS7_004719 [Eimeria intestinalis]
MALQQRGRRRAATETDREVQRTTERQTRDRQRDRRTDTESYSSKKETLTSPRHDHKQREIMNEKSSKRADVALLAVSKKEESRLNIFLPLQQQKQDKARNGDGSSRSMPRRSTSHSPVHDLHVGVQVKGQKSLLKQLLRLEEPQVQGGPLAREESAAARPEELAEGTAATTAAAAAAALLLLPRKISVSCAVGRNGSQPECELFNECRNKAQGERRRTIPSCCSQRLLLLTSGLRSHSKGLLAPDCSTRGAPSHSPPARRSSSSRKAAPEQDLLLQQRGHEIDDLALVAAAAAAAAAGVAEADAVAARKRCSSCGSETSWGASTEEAAVENATTGAGRRPAAAAAVAAAAAAAPAPAAGSRAANSD